MNFLQRLFDRRPAFDKLVELLDYRIDVYNGINYSGIAEPDHVKRRHLKIKIGVYESSSGDWGCGFSSMLFPFVEIWIDKDRNIVEMGTDFDMSGRFGCRQSKEHIKMKKRAMKLIEKMRKGDKLITDNSKLNKIIDWFYEGVPVYFIFLEDRILNQDFKLLMDHLTEKRECAAADKWKQKDYIHKLNCSK